jgi:CcmD family protein
MRIPDVVAAARRGRRTAWRGLVALLAAWAILAAFVPDPIVALQQPAGRADEFVPVGDLPVQEQLPAAPLLIAAYAFVWVALLVYVFMLWRRLSQVQRELQDLSRQVDANRRS